MILRRYGCLYTSTFGLMCRLWLQVATLDERLQGHWKGWRKYVLYIIRWYHVYTV